jgi:hypothetical protein
MQWRSSLLVEKAEWLYRLGWQAFAVLNIVFRIDFEALSHLPGWNCVGAHRHACKVVAVA